MTRSRFDPGQGQFPPTEWGPSRLACGIGREEGFEDWLQPSQAGLLWTTRQIPRVPIQQRDSEAMVQQSCQPLARCLAGRSNPRRARPHNPKSRRRTAGGLAAGPMNSESGWVEILGLDGRLRVGS